jgi:hypothetical protein
MINKLFDTKMGMNRDAYSLMHRLSELEPHTAEYIDTDDPRLRDGGNGYGPGCWNPGYQIDVRVRRLHNGREQGFVMIIQRDAIIQPKGYKHEATCIAFFTHRNCNEGICAVIWETDNGLPKDYYTWEDFPEGTTKYNYLNVKNEIIAEEMVLDEIAKYAEPIDQKQEVA